MSHRFRLLLSAVLCVALLVLAGCGAEQASSPVAQPALETRADSVAMQLYDAHGGPAAWASVPYLRFDFGVARNGETQVFAKHLWNRQTGDYRLEWGPSPDSQYVALFNVNAFGEAASESAPQAGDVYLNGTAVDSSAHATRMRQAHQRYVNDAYWLLAPVKVFDPGVNRSYVADSSDAQHDVIKLTFGEVGLTPGDTYWLYVDKETGRLDRWAFHLQGMPDDAPARAYDWTDYQSFDVPEGTVHLAARKPSVSGGGGLVFPTLDVPSDVPATMFSSPEPQL
ncbi:MAG: hypothetical protein GVY35_14955 [Bacteroidetes bacterium]|jgi:hypothetical protein|nr:hypothetical protein [Bacteroidota bacterium]